MGQQNRLISGKSGNMPFKKSEWPLAFSEKKKKTEIHIYTFPKKKKNTIKVMTGLITECGKYIQFHHAITALSIEK